MDCFSGSGLAVAGCPVRKKRSCVSRRPRADSKAFFHSNCFSPSSSTLPLGSGSNDTRVVCDGLGSESKLKKLKLKVGGVTHTIHTTSMDFDFGNGSSVSKPSPCSDSFQPQQKPLLLDDRGGYHFYSSDKGKGFGVRWKECSGNGSSYGKEHSGGKTCGESVSFNKTDKYESLRKSKRVPKRRVLDGGFNDGDEVDEEIRFLGRLNASKVAAVYEKGEKEESQKEQGMLKVSGMEDGIYVDDMDYYGSLRLGKDGRKKSRSEKIHEDRDYLEEEEPISDDEPGSKRKKMRKGSLDPFVEGRNESTPTTRNRALQSGKDVLLGSAANIIEFQNGLPPAPPKKQKEKLSEMEQLLKKAEAAQRRKMQSEKAAREAEAEAIRKILGQDSGRKKREEKMKKQRDELAQGKAANPMTLASNTVRWLFGPSGTVVTFSEDIGLPKIFNSVPCRYSYPPPREKCAGPNCTNAYKYRDSKSKLPLCSLHCYRAVHEEMQSLISC